MLDDESINKLADFFGFHPSTVKEYNEGFQDYPDFEEWENRVDCKFFFFSHLFNLLIFFFS